MTSLVVKEGYLCKSPSDDKSSIKVHKQREHFVNFWGAWP